jgi:hypothetical protein
MMIDKALEKPAMRLPPHAWFAASHAGSFELPDIVGSIYAESIGNAAIAGFNSKKVKK